MSIILLAARRTAISKAEDGQMTVPELSRAIAESRLNSKASCIDWRRWLKAAEVRASTIKKGAVGQKVPDVRT